MTTVNEPYPTSPVPGSSDEEVTITVTRGDIGEIIGGLQKLRQNCSLPMNKALPHVTADPNHNFGNEEICRYCAENRALQLRLQEVLA